MLVPYKAIVYYTYPFGRVVFCQSLTYGVRLHWYNAGTWFWMGVIMSIKSAITFLIKERLHPQQELLRRDMDVSQMSAVVTLQRLGFIFQVWSVWYVRLT